ncbi:MAG: helicase [Desmonostoc geniculatum HA4340-LM1]|jgi:hypothetical protein|nr:helicase [Desmonostoc geniculatum HA4340-LM1]
MAQDNLGQDLGRVFEVGFNVGILAYIKQNQLTHHFGDLYTHDLQKLSFPKMLRRLADQERVISEQHREIVAKWSTFFLQKGFLAGLNFLNEYIQSTGWNKSQLKRLEIVYYQCCFSDENSIGTHTKGKEQAFKDVLSQFGNSEFDIGKYSGKGEFLNADTLILFRYSQQLRVICVDLSVFYIKSIRDLVDVNNIEVLRNLLLSEISYLKSKSIFSNLGLDTKSSGINFSSDLAHYFTAFKREDKESIKLIQAASYAHSFYEFLHSQALLTDEISIIFNVVGYSDRSISAVSVNKDNLDFLATCSQIYKQNSSNQDIKEARKKVLNLIKQNAAISFEKGREFINRLLELSGDGINLVHHHERVEGFFNSIDIIPPNLATQLQVKPQSTLRDAHAELIQKALNSNVTYIFLTGNPGIGKTTAIAEFLQSQNCLDEGFLFFYVSPRKQVNLDIIDKFTNEDTKLLSSDKIFTINTNTEIIKNNAGKYSVHFLSNLRTDNFTEQTVNFINQRVEVDQDKFLRSNLKQITEDLIQEVGLNNRGVLDSICEAIYTIINRKISNNIVATVSIQSLKKTQSGKDTLHHFEKIFKDSYNESEGLVIPSKIKLISSRIKNLVIMIDEITGDDSGVEFLNGITRILRTYGLTDDKHGFNTKVIVADASIVDSNIIKQHLSETSAEPNKIFFRKAVGDCSPLSMEQFTFNSLNATVINANSYPAKSLNITYKVFIESIKFSQEYFKIRHKNLESRVQNQILEDINLFLENPSAGQVIVYIQDKPRLADLINKIKERRREFQYHHDYLEIHANLSEQEKKEINQYKNNVKVVFMTASASRGLSFPKTKHILVDIPRFEIEKNLMEIIQVIYRGRGDKTIDGEDKELIFYLSEQAVYYTNDQEHSLQESKLSLLNILLILKTSIMTRISGSWQIGREKFIMIPIGGKSVFAAGQTFSSKMDTLIKQLKKEYDRRHNDQQLQEVYLSLKQLLSQAEIVLRDETSSDNLQEISYLSLRESLTSKFLKLVNNGFDGLLDFTPIETGYISGSLLVVPIVGKTIEEKYKLRLEQKIINNNDGFLDKMYEISRNPKSPESLRSTINEAIDLVNMLQEKPHKTQRFEQHSHHFDQYYALPLFTFISGEAIAEYFSNNCEEPEDQRFRDILATYIQSMYPVGNIMPIGHKYRDFPFVIFRSYSLNEIRKKIFTDKYILISHELNVLNLILSQEG